MSQADHFILSASLLESLSAVIRHHLGATEGGYTALQPLSGRLIALRVEPFGRTLYLCPTTTDIQFFSEISGEPDVTIAGTLQAFAQARPDAEKPENFKAAKLTISGNIETAHQLQAFCQTLEIDWQRFFSRYLGFRLANSTLSLLAAGRLWTHDTLKSLQSDVSEYLREEARMLPDSSQIVQFCTDVDTLRADVDRLDARARRVLTAIENSKSPTHISP